MNFKKILTTKEPYVIAEIGINHNGKIDIAKRMIKKAKKSGANCVKFQFFSASKLITKNAPKAPYQKKNSKNSQLEIIKKCELTFNELKKLKNFCKKIKIDFLCTPFEIDSLKELLKIKVKAIKISSCNLNNIPFLKEAAKSKLPILLSTGMGNLHEVKNAINIFKKNKLLVFQCTSNYPANNNEANLAVINTYKNFFRVIVGYSDHTKEHTSAIVAFGMGVRVFEKHFTLSNKMRGIDQKASLNVLDFKDYVLKLKEAAKTIGTFQKKPSQSEKKVLISLRKSVVAKKDISVGEKLTLNMLEFKRPGNGIPTKEIPKIIGATVKRKIKKDTMIRKNQLHISR